MNKIVNGVANDFEFETLMNKEKISIYELGDIPNIYLVEELQQRIKKAIEMFDNKNLQKYYSGMSYEFEINNFKEDLLNILIGGDNNE